MSRHITDCKMYLIGLSNESAAAIEMHTDLQAAITNMGENISSLIQEQLSLSAIVWISLSGWLNLTKEQRQFIGKISKILVLPENMDMNDIDSFGSLGFSAILREPLLPKNINEAIYQAIEINNTYQDIYRMTREIILEREILGRKNANLNFLVNFLSSTSGLLMPNEILNVARENLAELMPVDDIAAFLWELDEQALQSEEFVPTMFIPAVENSADWNKWTSALLEAAKSITHKTFANYKEYRLNKFNSAGENAAKKTIQEMSIILPLRIRDNAVGVIIISFSEDFGLGRDNLEVLDSAMSHLALALRSTWLYRQVKNKAERDALTGLYNRRYFDERLQHELRRHERYGHELGIIMLDIDHFKSINDTFGHPLGDEVLRELSVLLSRQLRYADCVARYGGEEFVILLPYTTAEHAWTLADRLRRKIASHRFCSNTIDRKITVSLGVTGFRPELGITKEQLINQADVGLYKAKNQGRNCTVLEPVSDNLIIENVEEARHLSA